MGHGLCGAGLWRRYGGVPGEPLEVLDGSGHEELVAGAGEAPQSEPDHREDVLGLAEQPFDPLALDTGDFIGLGLHQALGLVAGVLMEVSLEPPCRAGGAAGLERAACTVTLLGDVFDRVAIEYGAGCF